MTTLNQKLDGIRKEAEEKIKSLLKEGEDFDFPASFLDPEYGNTGLELDVFCGIHKMSFRITQFFWTNENIYLVGVGWDEEEGYEKSRLFSGYEIGVEMLVTTAKIVEIMKNKK